MTPIARLTRLGLPAFCALAGLPSSIRPALNMGLEREDVSGVIGCYSWALRFRTRTGYKGTTANPVDYCDNEKTARYIYETLLAVPISAEDENIIKVAHALWRELGQTGRLASSIPFLTRQDLRNGLEQLIIERTRQHETLATGLPVADLLRMTGAPASHPEAIADVKTILQRNIEAISKSAKARRSTEQIQNDRTAFIGLYDHFMKIGVDVFLCGDTALRTLASGDLSAADRRVNLGHFRDCPTHMLEAACPDWQIDTPTQHPDFKALTSPDGLKLRLWHHTQEDGKLVRQNRYLKWIYTSADLQELRVQDRTFKLPGTASLIEEYGAITSIDPILGRSLFEAGNLHLKTAGTDGAVWLARQFSDALDERNRLDATIIIELLYQAYGLDYRTHIPPSTMATAAICTRDFATPSTAQGEQIARAHRLVTQRMDQHFSSFTPKETSINSDDAARALMDTKDMLAAADIPFFLLGGTLLGAAREGGFIAADYDIDIGVFDRDTDYRQLRKLLSHSDQFEIKEVVGAHLVKVIHSNGIEVDLFIHDRVDGAERHKGRVHEWFNGPFELAEIGFLGARYPVPANYRLWLDENYGHWENPALFYNVSFDTPNRKFVTDRVDGLYHLATQIRKMLTTRNRGVFLMATEALKTEFGLDIFDLPVLADKLRP
jgi:hypothetical protein